MAVLAEEALDVKVKPARAAKARSPMELMSEAALEGTALALVLAMAIALG